MKARPRATAIVTTPTVRKSVSQPYPATAATMIQRPGRPRGTRIRPPMKQTARRRIARRWVRPPLERHLRPVSQAPFEPARRRQATVELRLIVEPGREAREQHEVGEGIKTRPAGDEHRRLAVHRHAAVVLVGRTHLEEEHPAEASARRQ